MDSSLGIVLASRGCDEHAWKEDNKVEGRRKDNLGETITRRPRDGTMRMRHSDDAHVPPRHRTRPPHRRGIDRGICTLAYIQRAPSHYAST